MVAILYNLWGRIRRNPGEEEASLTARNIEKNSQTNILQRMTKYALAKF